MVTIRNTSDLRSVLAEQIQKLREGKISPAHANAIANSTGKWISSVRLEMEAAKMTGKQIRFPYLQLAEAD